MTNFPPIIISRLWNLPILDTRKLCQGRRRFIFWPFNCVLLLANWRDRYLPIGTKNKFCHFVSWMVCMAFFWRNKIGQRKLFLTEFCMFYFFSLLSLFWCVKYECVYGENFSWNILIKELIQRWIACGKTMWFLQTCFNLKWYYVEIF